MNIKQYYSKLSKTKKVQFVAAICFTLLLLAAFPVAAWFAYQRGIVKLQKIQSPNTLVLSAAHREDCVNFEINGINAEENAVDGFNDPILVNNQNKKLHIRIMCLMCREVLQMSSLSSLLTQPIIRLHMKCMQQMK